MLATKLPAFENHDGFGSSVPHSREAFRQMDGGIRVMADPEQQDLTIEVMNTTHRTVHAMGNVQRMIGGDPAGFRSDRGKCVRTVTAQDAR